MQRPKVSLVHLLRLYSGHHHLRRSDPRSPFDIYVQIEPDYLRIEQEGQQVEQ